MSASGDNTLKVWDLARGECLASFTGDSYLKLCATLPGGRILMALEPGAKVKVHILKLENQELVTKRADKVVPFSLATTPLSGPLSHDHPQEPESTPEGVFRKFVGRVVFSTRGMIRAVGRSILNYWRS